MGGSLEAVVSVAFWGDGPLEIPLEGEVTEGFLGEGALPGEGFSLQDGVAGASLGAEVAEAFLGEAGARIVVMGGPFG